MAPAEEALRGVATRCGSRRRRALLALAESVVEVLAVVGIASGRGFHAD